MPIHLTPNDTDLIKAAAFADYIEVADATARKLLATYSGMDPAVVPYKGMRVIQTDQLIGGYPTIEYLLENTNVTNDESWFARPLANPGTGKLPGYASSFQLNNVTTNTAKLALTGITEGGMVCVTGEANRIEQYIGNVHQKTVATGDLEFSGWSATGTGALYPVDGTWNISGSSMDRNTYAHSSGNWLMEWDGSKWRIIDSAYSGADAFHSTNDVVTPDLVTTWTAVGDGDSIGTITATTAEINSEAVDDNWVIIGPNTYELTMVDHVNMPDEINGVTMSGDTYLGWIKEGQVIHTGPKPNATDVSMVIELINDDTHGADNVYSQNIIPFLYLNYSGVDMKLMPLFKPPLRGSVFIYVDSV